MTEYEVDLIGGPLSGRRRLRTPRDEPPHQLAVAWPDTVATTDVAPGTRTMAVYRRNRRRGDRHVYSFAGSRTLPARSTS